MAEVIRMPRMSDTMQEGNIIAWHKKEGDKVAPGDLLAEIETDKATMDFESLWEGHLLHIAVKEGAVPVEAVIAVIGGKDEDWKAVLAAAQPGSNGKVEQPAGAVAEVQAAVPAVTTTTVAGKTPAVTESAGGSQRLKASPLAKSLAKEAGVDIANIKGTGGQGRIVKRDVEVFIETKEEALAATPVVPATWTIPAFTAGGQESFEDKPLSQMRKTIARRLAESKFSAPHFYLTMEINMDRVVEMRPRLNEVAPVKISFNDIVVKAAAAALRKHPAVNSSWLGDKIRTYQHIHLGVAVAVEEGLLVPVIRHADMKSLSQINTEVNAFAEKARNRKLQPEEMSGNTFTISNLGMFGIEEFTGIINTPDACILAVGSIVQKPIVKDGAIVVGNMMKVTLSCDHRVVDGATGAQFLRTLKGILEEPVRMLV
ncbi:MAG: pyruvate dehydrogenase complex dihydrolipoamide acetyltransferase [Saprospiraceae bacterium]|nr:MAG: pyruvate dehydrogenase complex dihydrolipoamide acetyltransferase [Saprospiraceae bacterium]